MTLTKEQEQRAEDVVVEALEHSRAKLFAARDMIDEALPIARQRAKLMPLYEQFFEEYKCTPTKRHILAINRLSEAIDEAKRQEKKRHESHETT